MKQKRNKVKRGDIWEAITEFNNRRIFLILGVNHQFEDCRYDEYRYVELTSNTHDVRNYHLSIRRTDELPEAPKKREHGGTVCTHYHHIWKRLN